MEIAVNWMGVVVAAVLSVVLGFIWYGPLFGKVWMKHSGVNMPDHKPSASEMAKPMFLSFIGAGIAAYVLSMVGASYSGAFWLWLGLVIPVYVNIKAWEMKSWTFVAVNTGYWLVYLLIAAWALMAL